MLEFGAGVWTWSLESGAGTGIWSLEHGTGIWSLNPAGIWNLELADGETGRGGREGAD